MLFAGNAGSQPVKTGCPEKSASRLVRSQRDVRWDFERFSKTRTTSLKKTRHEKQTVVQTGACLIGAASLLLQSCSESRFKDCDRLCGSWSSVEASPMSLYIRKGTLQGDGLRPQRKDTEAETGNLSAGGRNGNLFINTGYRIDIAYNEAADVLTFSPNGDYVRKEVRP